MTMLVPGSVAAVIISHSVTSSHLMHEVAVVIRWRQSGADGLQVLGCRLWIAHAGKDGLRGGGLRPGAQPAGAGRAHHCHHAAEAAGPRSQLADLHTSREDVSRLQHSLFVEAAWKTECSMVSCVAMWCSKQRDFSGHHRRDAATAAGHGRHLLYADSRRDQRGRQQDVLSTSMLPKQLGLSVSNHWSLWG